MIIWKNCVQLLKPTQFLFLASPPLKNKLHQVPLAKPLSPSPAAISTAHLLPQMLNPSCLPSSAPHEAPLWTSVGPTEHHSQQPTICLPLLGYSEHHLRPRFSRTPRTHTHPSLFAPAHPVISRDRMLTGNDRRVAMEIGINTHELWTRAIDTSQQEIQTSLTEV